MLDGENLKESVQAMLSTVISTEVQAHMGELKHMDAENWREVCAQFRGLFLRPDEFKFTDEELQQYDAQALTDLLQERASDIYARKEAELGEPLMRELERVMMLRVVDEYWMTTSTPCRSCARASACGLTARTTRWWPIKRKATRCLRA